MANNDGLVVQTVGCLYCAASMCLAVAGPAMIVAQLFGWIHWPLIIVLSPWLIGPAIYVFALVVMMIADLNKTP